MARRKWAAGFPPQSPEPDREAPKAGRLSQAVNLGLPNTWVGRALGEEGREQAVAQRCEAAWSGEEAGTSTNRGLRRNRSTGPHSRVLAELCPIGSKEWRGQVGLWKADSSEPEAMSLSLCGVIPVRAGVVSAQPGAAGTEERSRIELT